MRLLSGAVPAVLSRTPLGVRVLGQARLGPVTTYGDEVAPASVGLTPGQVGAVWTAAQALYRTGLHPGLSLVVRRHGEVVLDRSLGVRVLGEGAPMTSATPACLFSMSKAVTALVVHSLVEDGSVSLDAPVAGYLPEFAVAGKDAITVRDVMAHRAGLQVPPLGREDVLDLIDWEQMVTALCAATPRRPGKQAYHAVTGGFLLGEIAQRVTGRTLAELLAARLTGPLGLTTMTYGVPSLEGIATSVNTGPRYLPGASELVNRLLGVDATRIVPAMHTEAGLRAVVPAAGVYASAHDTNAMFQMLLDGGTWQGRQVLSSRTVSEARRPAGPKVVDGSIPVPIRFSAGFMLGEQQLNLFGRQTPAAFGHLGFTNILCWADPERDLSASLITTGKAVSPEGVVGMLALSTAISAFPRATARPVRVAAAAVA